MCVKFFGCKITASYFHKVNEYAKLVYFFQLCKFFYYFERNFAFYVKKKATTLGISDPPRLADTRRKCRVSERRGERTGIRCRDKEQRKGKGRWSGRWHRPEYMDRCHFERTMISSWKRRKLLSRINVRCINAIWFGEIAPKSGQMRRAGRGDDESVRGWKEGKRGWKEDEERETNKSDLLHPLLFCPAEEFKRQMAIPVRMFW